MPSPEFDNRLTATDAAFLYAERRTAPMQIGATGLFDGDMTYEELVNYLIPRVAQIPRFRQRVVMTPFNLGHPTWEYDTKFDIHNHLFEHQVDQPGGYDELRRAVAPVYSVPLSRKKPLWELHLIRGLEGGRSAITSSIHHAMMDGVGGNELIARLFDIEPNSVIEAVEPSPPPSRSKPENRVIDAMWDGASTAVDAWADYTSSLMKTANDWNKPEARQSRRTLQKSLPKLLRPVRRLPFNRSCSGTRHFAWSEFSFAEARAIRGEIGVTVNDVVLTVVAGAIARYAELHGESITNRTMRVMVPVSMRGHGGDGKLGNQVSALPVDVPLGEPDPILRAQQISETTKSLKESGLATELHRMSSLWGGLVPASMQALMLSQITPTQPVFNLVVTNVPGPQIPIYFAGRRVLSYLAMAPVGPQMGLTCQIFTYNQKMAIGLCADVRACPDVERIKDALDESFEELRIAAGVEPIEFIEIVPRRKLSTSTSTKPRQKPAPHSSASTKPDSSTESQSRQGTEHREEASTMR